MRKIVRADVATPSKSRPILLSRSQSTAIIPRLPPAPAAIIRDTKKLLEDKPIAHSPTKPTSLFARNSSVGAIHQSDAAVLKPIYAKPGTVIAAHRLSVDSAITLGTKPKARTQAPAHPSPQKVKLVANSSRELLQFVRAHNPASLSQFKGKMKRLDLMDRGEGRLPESEPNTSRRREASMSPLSQTRQSVPRFPNSQSLLSPTSVQTVLPRTVARFTHRTRTGSYNGIQKPQNQDSFLIVHDFAGCKYQFLFGVYDGHGSPYTGVNGHEVSGYLKKHLPLCLEHHLPRAMKSPESGLSPNEEFHIVSNSFVGTYIHLNQELMHRANIDCSFSGSTAVSVVVRGNAVMCANAGDSRAIVGKKGAEGWAAVPLSRDHKPDDPSERCRIEQMGGRVEPFKGNFPVRRQRNVPRSRQGVDAARPNPRSGYVAVNGRLCGCRDRGRR